MTFVIQKNNDIHGLFIHIPKCGGNSTYQLFSDQGYKLVRPNNDYLGHYKLNYSLDISKKYYGIDEMRNWKIYIQIREPIDWVESSYRYLINVPVSVHGHRWEHENFEKKGILWYVDNMLKHIVNGDQVPEEAVDPNHNSHAWHKLDSFLSLRQKDAEGLEDLDVAIVTNKSMSKLVNLLSPVDNEKYEIPWKNKTERENNILEALSGDMESYNRYKTELYNAHFSNHLNMMNELFDNGICNAKLFDLVVES